MAHRVLVSSSSAALSGARSSSRAAVVAPPALRVAGKRWLGAGGGPAPPPFVKMPLPAKNIHEHNDLIWNDGVVAETYLDFDAPSWSSAKAAAWLGGAFASLFGVYLFVDTVIDPEGSRPFARRDLPYDNLRVELGGPVDPEAEGYSEWQRGYQMDANHTGKLGKI